MEYLNLALEHLTFFLFAGMCWTILQTVKKVAPSPKSSPHARLFWQTLPMQPMLLGIAFGALSGAPTPASVKGLGSLAGVIYFGASGVFSCYVQDIVITILKHKPKNDAEPEPSIPPPPPTSDTNTHS